MSGNWNHIYYYNVAACGVQLNSGNMETAGHYEKDGRCNPRSSLSGGRKNDHGLIFSAYGIAQTCMHIIHFDVRNVTNCVVINRNQYCKSCGACICTILVIFDMSLNKSHLKQLTLSLLSYTCAHIPFLKYAWFIWTFAPTFPHTRMAEWLWR